MESRMLAPALLLLALVFSGCARQEAPLTEAQKAGIRQEVVQTMKSMWGALEKMDPAIMSKTCQYSPEFAFVTNDGKAYSFAEFSKVWAEMVAHFPSQKLVLRSEKVIVLAPDAALYCWQGSNDMTQKDGTVLRADPIAGTYLLRKVGKDWKGAYFQESNLPMTPVKPAETVPQKK